jgi:hypothetical protein
MLECFWCVLWQSLGRLLTWMGTTLLAVIVAILVTIGPFIATVLSKQPGWNMQELWVAAEQSVTPSVFILPVAIWFILYLAALVTTIYRKHGSLVTANQTLAAEITRLSAESDRRVAELEARLADGPIGWQEDAGEIEPYRERGISYMWQWQQPDLYPNVQTDVENWRIEMVERLTRKYGAVAAGDFNNIEREDLVDRGFTVATPQTRHIVYVAHLRRVIQRIVSGHYRSLAPGPF